MHFASFVGERNVLGNTKKACGNCLEHLWGKRLKKWSWTPKDKDKRAAQIIASRCPGSGGRNRCVRHSEKFDPAPHRLAKQRDPNYTYTARGWLQRS
jgi:hypothetical protein